MIGKMKDIGTVVVLLLVIMALMYISASCAPADGSYYENLDEGAYIGRYVDNEYNYVCYFTRSSPYDLQCFDIGR